MTTKRKTTRKKISAPSAPGATQPPGDEDDRELLPGDVVMLPDGAIASVERIVGRDAHVVEWQKTVGRGPWVFPIADLVVM